MKAIMILSSYFYLWKFKYYKDSVIAWPGRFTFPCMSLRLFFLFIPCNNKYTEAATGVVLYKKASLKISQNSQVNTCTRVSFLIKLQASGFKIIFDEISFKKLFQHGYIFFV